MGFEVPVQVTTFESKVPVIDKGIVQYKWIFADILRF